MNREMEAIILDEKKIPEVDPVLLHMLDRGLEDIEAGRTLPHSEAIDEIKTLRDSRRYLRRV